MLTVVQHSLRRDNYAFVDRIRHAEVDLHIFYIIIIADIKTQFFKSAANIEGLFPDIDTVRACL